MVWQKLKGRHKVAKKGHATGLIPEWIWTISVEKTGPEFTLRHLFQ